MRTSRRNLMSDDRARLVAELEGLLPALMRRVFVLDTDTPLTELPLAQMRLLRLLDEQPNLRVSQAAAELGTTPSAVTQMCHRLAATGYLSRLDDSDDGRGKRLALSEKGAQLLEARKNKRLAAGIAALQAATPEQLQAAVAALRALVDAAPRPREAEPMELIEAVEPHSKMA